jgi:hypothetical protein
LLLVHPGSFVDNPPEADEQEEAHDPQQHLGRAQAGELPSEFQAMGYSFRFVSPLLLCLFCADCSLIAILSFV